MKATITICKVTDSIALRSESKCIIKAEFSNDAVVFVNPHLSHDYNLDEGLKARIIKSWNASGSKYNAPFPFDLVKGDEMQLKRNSLNGATFLARSASCGAELCVKAVMMGSRVIGVDSDGINVDIDILEIGADRTNIPYFSAKVTMRYISETMYFYAD